MMAEPTNPEAPATKKKIVVLGGGLSGLSAAYELTDYPGWKDLYEVTLYQFGWQLGGKCKTGRGRMERIEEHGIHVFLGFYNNAMRMIRQAYAEREKFRKITDPAPFLTWESLFHKQSSVLLPFFSKKTHKWENYNLIFPENPDVPGIGEAPTEQVNIKKMILLALEMLMGSPYQQPAGCIGRIRAAFMRWIWKKESTDQIYTPKFKAENHAYPPWWEDLKQEVKKHHGHKGLPEHVQFLHHAKKLAHELPESKDHAVAVTNATVDTGHPHENIAHLLFGFLSGLEKRIAPYLGADSRLEMFWMFAQVGYYNYLGLQSIYNKTTGTYDFDSINDRDYRAWLIQLGAPDEVAWSPPVKDIYTLVFAYPASGDTTQPGLIAAGTALMGAMLIILGYKGSVMYRFKGGTADVVVSTIYEVLKERGVHFKFFHEVQHVAYSEGDEIESMTIGEQIRLKDPEAQFHATNLIKGLHCWAAHPFWRWDSLSRQIDPEDLAELQKGNVNLQSAWSGWKNRRVHTLEKGKDFDQVVLAISIAALKDICPDIISKRPAWSDMVNNVQTIQTQGVQLWVKKSLAELGMDLPALGMQVDDMPILDTYNNPINSYADMTELLKWEDWSAVPDKPRSLAYFCGPLSENGPIPPYTDTDFPLRQQTRVKEMTTQWLQDNAGFLWPTGTTHENPDGFDLDLLADPSGKPGATGLEKLNEQFYSANIDPTERYVLSLPGSGKYRLKTDQSGYKNLFLAGDWIDSGYNMGCAEVAIMSGLLAAQALRTNAYGLKDHKPIIKDLNFSEAE